METVLGFLRHLRFLGDWLNVSRVQERPSLTSILNSSIEDRPHAKSSARVRRVADSQSRRSGVNTRLTKFESHNVLGKI